MSGATAPRPHALGDEMKPWRRPADECPKGRVEAFGARPRATTRETSAFSKVFWNQNAADEGGQQTVMRRERRPCPARKAVATGWGLASRKLSSFSRVVTRARAPDQTALGARPVRDVVIGFGHGQRFHMLPALALQTRSDDWKRGRGHILRGHLRLSWRFDTTPVAAGRQLAIRDHRGSFRNARKTR